MSSSGMANWKSNFFMIWTYLSWNESFDSSFSYIIQRLFHRVRKTCISTVFLLWTSSQILLMNKRSTNSCLCLHKWPKGSKRVFSLHRTWARYPCTWSASRSQRHRETTRSFNSAGIVGGSVIETLARASNRMNSDCARSSTPVPGIKLQNKKIRKWGMFVP